jgi:rhomboid protease GluP
MSRFYYNKNGKLVNRNLPYVTIVLIVINVVVFLGMELTGSTEDTIFLYNHGAMYWPSVFENGEWYRLITHMFVHSGPEHLLNNMFMLGILGYQIEREYGTIKYLITYMICGAGGAMLSAFVEMRMNEAPVSVGASGAVFGIFGVMLVMIFKNKRIDGQATALRLVILLVLMVFGNMEEGVDWMAHLGGALMGVMLAFILYRTKKKNNIEGGYYG